jgi:AraC family transcriptional regulator, positive regulator of tynA and feaB
MTTRNWSTRSVPQRDQFAFWREAVCEAVLNVATEHPTDGFRGDITCSQFGDLRFATFASTPHEVIRRKSHIGRSGEAHYLVSWQRGGTCRMFQNDASCELQPGDIGVVDGTRPFRVEFPQPVDRVVAVIPHAQLHSRAPWLDRRPLNRVAGTSPLNGALRFYLERLAGPACASVVEASALTENICNILALLTATSDSERSSARQFAIKPGLDEMLAVLRLHLANPDLAPKMLAERLGVSVRTIHNRFEDSNTTFGQWVLENRLQACRRALGDPRHASFTVSEIAYGWGFNDLSHFSKAFKARFGLSPARYRHANRTTNHA